jgi:hypothetical protein
MQTKHISGKIGDKVYYQLRGKQVVRKKPAPRKTELSPLEMQSRSKFAFIVKFLLPLKSLLNESFGSTNMSGLNKAISVNFKNVIPDDGAGWRMDLSKLSVGKGEVGTARDLLLSTQESGQLTITWNAKSRPRCSNAWDHVYVAVYCENLNQWQINIGSVQRKDGSIILDAGIFSGLSVHVYFGFISKFMRRSSDSQYLGEVGIV